MKILRICEERGMMEAYKRICRTMSVRALKEKNLSVAMGWCLQSKVEMSPILLICVSLNEVKFFETPCLPNTNN